MSVTTALHETTRVAQATMKAVVQDRYGTADRLSLAEIDIPTPAASEVRLRVRASSTDAAVGHLMTGTPYMMRPALGIRGPKHRPGLVLAGIADAVGSGVTRFRPGDEVVGWAPGAFAEYAIATETNLLPKPATVSFAHAATAPISGVTALQALRDQGHVEAGQRVLVTGAGGGVGSFAVQIAKAAGARVTGVCPTPKVDMVRALGADEVIDYTTTDFTTSGAQWDLIIDTAGRRSLRRMRRTLSPTGSLVVVGGEGGGKWLAGFPQRILAAILLSIGRRQKLRWFVSADKPADLATLLELMADGKVVPWVGHTFPLADTRDAMRLQSSGRALGKIVITV
jgi:NADPH:quinone reductase-like Zn-dependent oxidoreductase